MLISAPTLVGDISSSTPMKGRKYIQKIEDGYDLDLDDYYVEDWFTKDGSCDLVIKLCFLGSTSIIESIVIDKPL
jgi:hypothetical protein